MQNQLKEIADIVMEDKDLEKCYPYLIRFLMK